MKLRRANPITFHREDGTVIVVPPIQRGQMEKILELDPEGLEDPVQAGIRRGKQIAILLRDAVALEGESDPRPLGDDIKTLEPEEEIDIIQALVAAHHGYSPKTAVEVQQALREIQKKKFLTSRGTI